MKCWRSCFILLGWSLGGWTQTVHVDIIAGHAINSFDPDSALGSSIDVLSRTGIDKVYSPHIIQESLSAGWGPITYRNNTELRMAAWHWTENGEWSDPAHKSGYFTGSPELKEPLRYILSYALPHRGFSTSGDRPVQGPNLSYWKSNPYLTSKFTGESDVTHPQWVVTDLRSEKAVNAVRIAWATPTRPIIALNIGMGRTRSISTMARMAHGKFFRRARSSTPKGARWSQAFRRACYNTLRADLDE